jgi:hypothetical protein
MYIITLAGFLAYTDFIGYFPDFRKGISEEHNETARKQPRFIEALFGYIMIPIMLALTLVLLVWAGKTALGGMRVSFRLLSGIAASYTIGGLWLHVMVTGHKSGLAKVYRLFYPLASLVILIFEAWAVINQLAYSGLKLAEYIFILIWIVTAAGAIMLLILKSKAHQSIAVLTCVIVIISVLPSVGYYALPVTAQVRRLEALLVSENMLEGDSVKPAAAEPAQDVREAITDSITYLAGSNDVEMPAWFDKTLINDNVFKMKLGFEKTWAEDNDNSPIEHIGTYLSLAPEPINISAYTWVVNPNDEYGTVDGIAVIEGSRGVYRINWESAGVSIPSVRITLDGSEILQQDLSSYVDEMTGKFPQGNAGNIEASPEDMSVLIETPQLSVLIIFNNVNISVNANDNTGSYWFDLYGIYLKEKTVSAISTN